MRWLSTSGLSTAGTLRRMSVRWLGRYGRPGRRSPLRERTGCRPDGVWGIVSTPGRTPGGRCLLSEPACGTRTRPRLRIAFPSAETTGLLPNGDYTIRLRVIDIYGNQVGAAVFQLLGQSGGWYHHPCLHHPPAGFGRADDCGGACPTGLYRRWDFDDPPPTLVSLMLRRGLFRGSPSGCR